MPILTTAAYFTPSVNPVPNAFDDCLRLPEVDPALVDAGVLHLHAGDDELSGTARVSEVRPV
jgi:hypothetical protein